MIKTTEKQFTDFKTEFLNWINKLGLTGYKIYFEMSSLEDAFARIFVDFNGGIARVILTSDIDDEFSTFFNPAEHARHEALELLTMKLYYYAKERFVDKEEIDIEQHNIIRKLENYLNTEIKIENH